ncbi:MAG: peptidase M28 [Peptococcaceae bacterium BICA1-8]|nr:MAG: peptidase M28 [Peptococcaceae bacterium BICA1-8]
MDSRLQLIKELTDLHGVSGFEEEVRHYIKERLENITEIAYDNLGSIICKKTGSDDGPKIMLPGHIDEIGFLINAITKEGFLKFIPLGGWWDQVLLAHRVIVKTSKGNIPGIIGSTPPHLLDAKEREKVVEKKTMFIDIGAESKEEAMEKFGIRPGDVVVPESNFSLMHNPNYIMAKALDDRLGVALFIEVLEELAKIEHPNTIYGVGTVQEEVGLRGAQTSTDMIKPDLTFVLDVGIAGDTPGLEGLHIDVKLGKGPILLLADASMIPNRSLRDFVIDTANSHNIPLQFATMMGGGTDGGAIHKYGSGVPTVSFGIPTRYIHSHTSTFHREDYESLLRLLIEMIKILDASTVDLIRK